MTTKQKGSIGELAVAADLVKRGYQVAVPFGEHGDWDLVVERGSGFERIQVKFAQSDGDTIPVRPRCHSVVAGRVARTVAYTAHSFEWLAVYEPRTDACYYLRSSELNGNGGTISLRLSPPKHPNKNIRWAKDYLFI